MTQHQHNKFWLHIGHRETDMSSFRRVRRHITDMYPSQLLFINSKHFVIMKTIKEIKTAIIKEGGKEFKNIKVKNVTATVKDKYLMLGFTLLDKEVPCMVADENGEYQLGTSNVIFTSGFTVATLLQEDEKTAFLGNRLKNNPDGCEILLSHCTIDLLQETIEGETDYINPFSNRTEPEQFTHETIINHVTRIELSETAKGYLRDIILDSMRQR